MTSMNTRPKPKIIFENLIPFAITGILFGVIYNALFYPHTLVDISAAIYEAKGEIYQYVGDEVVIVWPGDQTKGHPNWLHCYEGMREAVEKVATVYQKTYGITPEFKAGVHGGLVIASEVGSLQRAYVYHGDVLNTAARIQAKCNEVGFDLLVSDLLVAEVPSIRRQEFQRVGAIPLRGKMEEVVIYGFQPRII